MQSMTGRLQHATNRAVVWGMLLALLGPCCHSRCALPWLRGAAASPAQARTRSSPRIAGTVLAHKHDLPSPVPVARGQGALQVMHPARVAQGLKAAASASLAATRSLLPWRRDRRQVGATRVSGRTLAEESLERKPDPAMGVMVNSVLMLGGRPRLKRLRSGQPVAAYTVLPASLAPPPAPMPDPGPEDGASLGALYRSKALGSKKPRRPPAGTGQGQHPPPSPKGKGGGKKKAQASPPPPAPAAAQSAAVQMVSWPGIGALAHRISYHGGRLLAGNVTLYFIYYGNWTGDFGHAVLENFVKSTRSPALDRTKGVPTLHQWWQATSLANLGPGAAAQGGTNAALVAGPRVVVNRGYKTALADGFQHPQDDILAIVLQQIGKKALPLDPKGIYVVLTGNDVQVGDSQIGFCSLYCGWHRQHAYSKGVQIQYAFVGDATTQCNGNCGQNLALKSSANGKYKIDSLVSTLAHEVLETITNPDGQTGWWALSADGKSGYESADLCNGVFSDVAHPALSYGPGRAFAYNLRGLRGQRFLVQTSVNFRTQKCVLM